MNETNKRCDARDSCKIIESFEKINANLNDDSNGCDETAHGWHG